MSTCSRRVVIAWQYVVMTGVGDTEECFYIAPIGVEGSSIRKRSDGVLKFVVAPAADALGLTAVRGDAVGEPGEITLQVIEKVMTARAAVADLTGSNPNVFYELAIRHTARLPVVLICDRSDERLPFDIAQMRTIFFDSTDLSSAADCRQQIEHQLRNALGGAVSSPVATAIDLRELERGSVVERALGDVVTRMEDLHQIVTLIRDVMAETSYYLMRRDFVDHQSRDSAQRRLRQLDELRRDIDKLLVVASVPDEDASVDIFDSAVNAINRTVVGMMDEEHQLLDKDDYASNALPGSYRAPTTFR